MTYPLCVYVMLLKVADFPHHLLLITIFSMQCKGLHLAQKFFAQQAPTVLLILGVKQ